MMMPWTKRVVTSLSAPPEIDGFDQVKESKSPSEGWKLAVALAEERNDELIKFLNVHPLRAREITRLKYKVWRFFHRAALNGEPQSWGDDVLVYKEGGTWWVRVVLRETRKDRPWSDKFKDELNAYLRSINTTKRTMVILRMRLSEGPHNQSG